MKFVEAGAVMQELRGSNPRLDISLCPHISSQLVEGGGPPEEGVGRWYLVSSGHFWMKVAKTNLRERGSFFFFSQGVGFFRQ